LLLNVRAGGIQHGAHIKRLVCEFRHSYAEEVMESSRLKVNRERIDASRNAEIGLGGLRTNDDRSGHRFVTAWPAHLVTVVKKEHQELLGARWQRDLKPCRIDIGCMLAEVFDVRTKSRHGNSSPNVKHCA